MHRAKSLLSVKIYRIRCSLQRYIPLSRLCLQIIAEIHENRAPNSPVLICLVNKQERQTIFIPDRTRTDNLSSVQCHHQPVFSFQKGSIKRFIRNEFKKLSNALFRIIPSLILYKSRPDHPYRGSPFLRSGPPDLIGHPHHPSYIHDTTPFMPCPAVIALISHRGHGIFSVHQSGQPHGLWSPGGALWYAGPPKYILRTSYTQDRQDLPGCLCQDYGRRSFVAVYCRFHPHSKHIMAVQILLRQVYGCFSFRTSVLIHWQISPVTSSRFVSFSSSCLPPLYSFSSTRFTPASFRERYAFCTPAP